MTYDELLYEAEKQGIEVVEMKFKGKSSGLYADNTIALSKDIETVNEKRCVLAEELGHHYTSSGNILDAANVVSVKQEKRARYWAYKRLIGIVDLVNGYKFGAKNRYELAEYLNVTEEFLENALINYKEKYGLYYEIDNYVIYFDPLIVLEMF